MAQYGAKRVLILTDPQINVLGIPARIRRLADQATGISSEISTGCTSSPPTTAWTRRRATPASRARGGFVAVGAARPSTPPRPVNLLTTDGGELMDYINKPIGHAQAPKQQLKSR